MKKIFFVIFLFLPVIAVDHEQEDGPNCCDIIKIIFIGFLRQLPTYPQTPRIYQLQRLPKPKKPPRTITEKEN